MLFSRRPRNSPNRAAREASPLPPQLAAVLRESWWFAAVVAGIYLVIILASYHRSDPGWSHVATQSTIRNHGGAFGAWLSDVLLYLFGFSAWWWVVFCIAAILWGYRRLERIEQNRRAVTVAVSGYLLLVFSSAGLEALRLGSWQIELPFGPGGMLGWAVGGWLFRSVGFSGATLLLLAGFAIGLSLFAGISWLGLMERLGGWIEDIAIRLFRIYQARQDRKIGAEAAIAREARVSVEKQKIEEAPALRIEEPSLGLPPLSAREMEQEKKELEKARRAKAQPSLFATEDLPPWAEPAVAEPKPVPRPEPTTKVEAKAEAKPEVRREPTLAPVAEPMFDEKAEFEQEPAFEEVVIPPVAPAIEHEITESIVIEPPASHHEDDFFDEPLALREPEPKEVRKPEPLPLPLEAPPLQSQPVLQPKTVIKKTPALITHDRGELPNITLLEPPPSLQEVVSHETVEYTSRLIERKLAEFGVEVKVVAAYPGPVITRYEIEPAVGVKGSQIVNLMKDLARALGLISIRVVETIPGKTYMGLELPNPKRQVVRLSEIIGSQSYHDSGSLLTMALGKDISGKPVVTDLARAPHMLVAGTTGSGKSVAMNAIILSLLYKATADEVRLIMVDPKMLELSVYEGIPHLLAPVVTDMKHAANALNWCVAEMEKRYRLMSAMGVRNIAGFNQKLREAEKRGEKITNPFSLTPDSPEPLENMPFIVVLIDELADLMMVAGKKIEELIARLAQKARAAGIHLILATQRPSVDVITGLIKANIPTRCAFQVSSKIDSRTILDQMGAETLLGQGDALFLPPGTGYPQRIHGAFVADEEVHAVVDFLKSQGEPNYIEGILTGTVDGADGGAAPEFGLTGGGEGDELYDQAVAFVIKSRKASISSVQRQLRIGYNRAARLIEQMEQAGLVSPMETNGNRTVLVPAREE